MAAGICIPLGGFIASFERIRARWLEQELRYFLIALGGGILLGAVVLVPEGIASMQGSMLAIPIVLAGGLVFFLIERALGLRWREAPQVMGMLLDYVPEERRGKIELFYLPSYSPELNPEERLNADLKYAIGSEVPTRTNDKLKAAATEHVQALEQEPERVKKYFQDPRVKYAA